MPLPRVLRQLSERLPAPDLLPKTHSRYDALSAARAAVAHEVTAPHDAVNIALPFPWAAKDPARQFSLSSGVRLSLEDRWFICGAIGCGKTTLARELMSRLAMLYPMASRYILDSKGDGLFDNDDGIWTDDDVPPLVGPGEQLIWKPGRDDVDAYSAWFDTILKGRTPCIVYVDELGALSRGPRSHAEGYTRLIKMGRSLHQCVISLSQEAVGIPRVTRNQVMHGVRMRLLDDIDAARMDRLLQGNPKPRREPSRPHGLIYRRLDRPEMPREFSDWRELLA